MKRKLEGQNRFGCDLGNKRIALYVLAATFLGATAAASQEEPTHQRPIQQTSELGRENLSRVAASAADIKTILVKDSGLMVELKRWVARDATAQGQLITDVDLSDDTIFDRLQSDVQFRSVATQLVQRYGYLVPQLNPDSAAGKEQELLVKERVKLMVQREDEEEQQRIKLRKARNGQSSINCNALDPQCSEKTGSYDDQFPAQRRGQDTDQGYPPTQIGPDNTNPRAPSGNDQLLRTGLDTSQQVGLQGDTNLPELPLGGGLDPMAGLGAGSSGLTGSILRGGRDPESSTNGNFQPTAGTESRNVVDSLAVYGIGSSAPSTTSNLEDLYRSNRRDTNASSSTASSSTYSPMLPRDRRYQPKPQPPEPELVRAPSPYNDIPSLYDMYVQAIPRPTLPKRFGAEVFENGTRDSQLIPMDVPAGPDYVVGPGDGLSIDMWGGVSQRIFRIVDREGRVSLPEVGPVLVSGKSLADVQASLQDTLRTQFRQVSAAVSLSRLRTIRVYEVGDIANPGAYDISSLSTPLNALFVAGGPTQKGSLRIVKHYRGDQLVQVVDLYDLLLHGVRSGLQQLENGDSILVPPVGPQVTVDGMVRRPAIYELKDEKNLSSVLDLAGGLLPTATLRHIEVQRLVKHQDQTMLSLDISEADTDSEITKKLEAFEISDGDRIRVFPIPPYNRDAVYVEGHVIRPGRYSYRANMRVTDVIASYKDLLPEPAGQYAEIVRLNPPDFHPTVESFDLSAALANPAQSPTLQAMDTVRIFSRFDFENPPTVSVFGDVRGPGTFRTTGQIHLSDAVHLAGGISPDAKIDDAQVFRYQPDGKMKIFSVSLNLALEGDPSANIWLQPRDRLLIHKSPDTIQPATVYIQGAVGKPGRYPLTTNMTVADLIRTGGGLKPSADNQTADLTHYSWADKGELTGSHQSVTISEALAGETTANISLNNGDVLTIRQLPNWTDLGASISVKGEVNKPGPYGIRPGEKLSSVLERAGGFGPLAYPYGAVLMRREVREFEMSSRQELVRRLKQEQLNLKQLPEAEPDQKNAKLTAIAETETTLQQLQANPPIGRVVVRIPAELKNLKNTTADVPVRDGDVLLIPKKADYVMVNGQVFNPTAVSYRPGRSARWYLSQAGGTTQLADKKAVFVVRADGSVLSAKNNQSGWWSGDPLGSSLRPGDSVVVPEAAPRIGTRNWQTLFQAGQLATSAALAVAYIHP
ncbi:MAG: SLBB domain-containing protein [Acidobacteria bacterium]|nr:SLBB domain-containing protein [Acidobacteriota bacterium]